MSDFSPQKLANIFFFLIFTHLYRVVEQSDDNRYLKSILAILLALNQSTFQDTSLPSLEVVLKSAGQLCHVVFE